MDNAHSESVAYGDTETYQKNMELFWTGNNVQNYAHVLCQLLYVLRRTGERLVGYSPKRRIASIGDDAILK